MHDLSQKTKNTTQKILTLVLIWLATLFLLNTLFSSVSNAFNNISYIQAEQQKLYEIQLKKTKFENELKYKQSQLYLSNRALNDLGYSDPTAKIFFIKDDSNTNAQTIELKTEILFPEESSDYKSNLDKWLEIFLN